MCGEGLAHGPWGRAERMGLSTSHWLGQEHGVPGDGSCGSDAVYAPGAGLQGASLGVQENLEGP